MSMSMSLVKSFRKGGVGFLEKCSEKLLTDLLVAANESYYNDSAGLLTDNEYDIIKEFVELNFSGSQEICKIGAPVTGDRKKVVLPYFMPSMNKIKPDTNVLRIGRKNFQQVITLFLINWMV